MQDTKTYIVVTRDGCVVKRTDVSELRELLKEFRGELQKLYSIEPDGDDSSEKLD